MGHGGGSWAQPWVCVTLSPSRRLSLEQQVTLSPGSRGRGQCERRPGMLDTRVPVCRVTMRALPLASCLLSVHRPSPSLLPRLQPGGLGGVPLFIQLMRMYWDPFCLPCARCQGYSGEGEAASVLQELKVVGGGRSREVGFSSTQGSFYDSLNLLMEQMDRDGEFALLARAWQTEGPCDGWTEGRMNGWMARTGGRMERRVGGWVDGEPPCWGVPGTKRVR